MKHNGLQTAARAEEAAKPAEKKTRAKRGEGQPKRRPCGNCGRVMNIIGFDLCVMCYRAAHGLTGTARADALAETKRRIDAGEVRRGGRGLGKAKKVEGEAKEEQKSGAIDAGIQLESKPKVEGELLLAPARVFEGTSVISLDFAGERNRAVYDALLGAATRQRRTPEQQAFWIIENSLGIVAREACAADPDAGVQKDYGFMVRG